MKFKQRQTILSVLFLLIGLSCLKPVQCSQYDYRPLSLEQQAKLIEQNEAFKKLLLDDAKDDESLIELRRKQNQKVQELGRENKRITLENGKLVRDIENITRKNTALNNQVNALNNDKTRLNNRVNALNNDKTRLNNQINGYEKKLKIWKRLTLFVSGVAFAMVCKAIYDGFFSCCDSSVSISL